MLSGIQPIKRLEAVLEGVGLRGPELSSWEQGKAILSGDGGANQFEPGEHPLSFLSPNQRRRVTPAMGLALQVANEAVIHAGLDPKDLISVFASSDGELAISDRLCRALSSPGRPLSPTDFHNSVHNAPAAYWAIATKAKAPYQAIAAYDATFSVGLLEAITQTTIEEQATLFVCYDHPAPNPLCQARDVPEPFAAALAFSLHSRANEQIGLAVEIASGGPESRCRTNWMESLRLANPAARSLPLLESIARREERRVLLPYLSGRYLAVEIEFC